MARSEARVEWMERSRLGWEKRRLVQKSVCLDRHAGGSSSGSGAATAANLCAVSIGTETDGSINGPSTVNAIVGIKPTVGLISRSGLIPISMTQDTAGPMTRTVRDAAILLGALVGLDPLDEATKASQGKSHTDFTQFLGPAGLLPAFFDVCFGRWITFLGDHRTYLQEFDQHG